MAAFTAIVEYAIPVRDEADEYDDEEDEIEE